MTEAIMHRKARLPRWGGQHGSVVRGSVTWSGEGYRVIYSYLLGYESTLKASDVWATWGLAMSEYRQHDRTVRERQALEKFRSGGRIHGLAAQTYS